MRAVISATAFSPARRTMAWTSARRGQRSHRRRVSRRKTSSRVRSGNIVLLRSVWASLARKMTKGRRTSHLPCLSGSELGRLGILELLIRRVGVMPAGAPSFCSCRLLCGLLGRYDRYEGSALTRQESDAAIGRGEERMVFAHADIHARVHFRAALTNDDVAGEHLLIAELLDAQTTACGVAA